MVIMTRGKRVIETPAATCDSDGNLTCDDGTVVHWSDLLALGNDEDAVDDALDQEVTAQEGESEGEEESEEGQGESGDAAEGRVNE